MAGSGHATGMAVAIAVLAAVALFSLGTYTALFRRVPGDDTARFHHAREITSSWSETYDGGQASEQPEASEGKPDLQHSVFLVDA